MLVALIIILEWLSFVMNPLRTEFDVNATRCDCSFMLSDPVQRF